MSPLYIDQGKLIIKDGKLGTTDSCCCCPKCVSGSSSSSSDCCGNEYPRHIGGWYRDWETDRKSVV